MAREKQYLPWSHNGSSVNCLMPTCVNAVEYGGSQLYKVWIGYPNSRPPAKFDVEEKLNVPIPMAGGEDLTSWHTKKHNFICLFCNQE